MPLPEQGISSYILNYGNTFQFTVNTGVTSVQATLSGATILSERAAEPYFAYADNVFIEKIHVFIPYQFGLSVQPTIPCQIQLGWVDKNANSGLLSEFGSNSFLNLPESPLELPINNMINIPQTADSPWAIRMTAVGGWFINMINTPAVLNTQVLDMRVFLKIRHTLPMVA